MEKPHRIIVPEEQPITKEQFVKIHEAQNPALRIQTASPFLTRIWNLIKNPFTYIFYGRIEY